MLRSADFIVLIVVLAVAAAAVTATEWVEREADVDEVTFDALLFGADRCNIAELSLADAEADEESFIDKFIDYPAILRAGPAAGGEPPQRNQVLVNLLQKQSLLSLLNNSRVILSTANAQSYKKKEVRLAEYVDAFMRPWQAHSSSSADGGRLFYHFGDNRWDDAGWQAVASHYDAVRLLDAAARQSLSFGLGPSGSGVPFHTHGPVFADLFYGRKRWFFYPPDRTRLQVPFMLADKISTGMKRQGEMMMMTSTTTAPARRDMRDFSDGMPPFDDEKTSLHWLTEVYPFLSQEHPLALTNNSRSSSNNIKAATKAEEEKISFYQKYYRPLECTARPGDVVWIPSNWFHSTINIGETVFISAFV